MDNEKRIAGQIIKSIDKTVSGKTSYLVIKFESDLKMNIVSTPNLGKGTGQIDIEFKDTSLEKIIGDKVRKIDQEFDGSNDYIIIETIGGQMNITAFNSAEDDTAKLDMSVYKKSLKESFTQEIAVAINSNIITDARIIRILKGHYDNVKISYEDKDNNIKIITVRDEEASIEDISDLLFSYIESGVVETVDIV